MFVCEKERWYIITKEKKKKKELAFLRVLVRHLCMMYRKIYALRRWRKKNEKGLSHERVSLRCRQFRVRFEALSGEDERGVKRKKRELKKLPTTPDASEPWSHDKCPSPVPHNFVPKISGYDELLLVVRHYATSRANESLARTLWVRFSISLPKS